MLLLVGFGIFLILLFFAFVTKDKAEEKLFSLAAAIAFCAVMLRLVWQISTP